MGRRGWGGTPPSDDTEARSRIVEAAIHSIERRGPRNTTLSDVAGDLGVTRPTIYRHFATSNELLVAASEATLGDWTARIGALVGQITDPTELLVEAIAYVVEWLPAEPLLELLLETERGRTVSRGMVVPAAIAQSRVMLEQAPIDWAAHGYVGAAMDDLVEFLLRMIQSMVIAPTDRSPADLRNYLRRWIEPVMSAHATIS
jgi:AcrR family transcriptional regulator